MRQLFLFFIPFISSFITIGQKNIPLTNGLENQALEYSGLCKLGSWIVLLPQYPEKSGVYGVDSNDIQKILTEGIVINPVTHSWKIKGLEGINQRIIGYEGFEAITLLDSILFCSIETRSENDTCYVIRGVVSKDTIEFDLKSLFPLLKRKRKKAGYNIAIENAGFECLTYVKNLDKLLLLFEYNNYPLTSSAFLLNTELTKIDTVDLQSIDFRLTDICEGNDRMVYAINHHYNGDYLAYEPDTVILKNNKKRYNWVNDSYSSIVKIDISKNKYTIKPVGTISPAVNNWEGIVPFYKGFLLVTDYYPGSKLVYFEF